MNGTAAAAAGVVEGVAEDCPLPLDLLRFRLRPRVSCVVPPALFACRPDVLPVDAGAAGEGAAGAPPDALPFCM